MKACIIQPEYSLDFRRSDELFQWELDAMDRCDESMDLIVLPESTDTPCLAKGQDQRLTSYRSYNARILEKASQTAKRCNAVLFLNARSQEPEGLRNATYAFDRNGRIVGKYFKQHLTPGECTFPELDHSYSYVPTEPAILEIDGVRYGFLVCYDFYFYENFANIARYDPDVIIGCSHQRSDTHQALMILSQFLAYNTNAYVVRSSVSLGEDSPVGGGSMVVAPDGTVLANMESRIGMTTVEFDPHKRYVKPAGFGNPPDVHHHYVEAGRRPWKYRNGGSAIVQYDDILPYPRVCAHRGFNTVAPENSMPAFGAAVAMGAEEIEFDLWPSKDGILVSTHDHLLERVSNGTGHVWEHTLAQLKELDFGSKFGEEYAGLKIPTFAEILQKFSGHVIMNIHVKHHASCPVTEEAILQIRRLIHRYDGLRHCYLTSGSPDVLELMRRTAPEIPRCAGASNGKQDLVQKAQEYGCSRIQLFQPHFVNYPSDYVEEICRRAHSHGLRVNYFWSDDPREIPKLLAQGCDTILTNDYGRIRSAMAKAIR